MICTIQKLKPDPAGIGDNSAANQSGAMDAADGRGVHGRG